MRSRPTRPSTFIGLAVLAAAAIGCTMVTPGGAAPASGPEAVLQAVFDAAGSGDTTRLAGLCSPDGLGDGDVKDICAVTAGSPEFDSFTKAFRGASIVGAPRVEGDQAKIDFRFGPEGPSRMETMTLVLSNGSWYLLNF